MRTDTLLADVVRARVVLPVAAKVAEEGRGELSAEHVGVRSGGPDHAP